MFHHSNRPLGNLQIKKGEMVCQYHPASQWGQEKAEHRFLWLKIRQAPFIRPHLLLGGQCPLHRPGWANPQSISTWLEELRGSSAVIIKGSANFHFLCWMLVFGNAQPPNVFKWSFLQMNSHTWALAWLIRSLHSHLPWCPSKFFSSGHLPNSTRRKVSVLHWDCSCTTLCCQEEALSISLLLRV